MGVSQHVRSALEPYVGSMVADTCVRATALSIGKFSDDLDASDMPQLEASIRKLLAPVAPPAAIEDALSSLKGLVQQGA